MKCQSPFSRENMKNESTYHLLKFLPSMLSIKKLSNYGIDCIIKTSDYFVLASTMIFLLPHNYQYLLNLRSFILDNYSDGKVIQMPIFIN